MKSLILVILFLLLATGPAAADVQTRRTGNANLTDENIARVKAGMQAEEVTAIIGRADEIIERSDGAEDWIYTGSSGTFKRAFTFGRKTSVVDARMLTVTVNPGGFVSNVAYDALKKKA